jgi:hypothetical protein
MITKLTAQKLWTCDSRPTSRTIHCKGGQLWITREGDLRDYFLRGGEQQTFPKKGRLVVMGLTDSAFALVEKPWGRHFFANWLFPGRGEVLGPRSED